jgi:hypothetical protein
MAIDTAAKRASAINPGSPWRAHVPFPDGAIGQGDRQATAFWYSGILAGAAVAAIPDVVFTLPSRNNNFTLPARNNNVTLGNR